MRQFIACVMALVACSSTPRMVEDGSAVELGPVLLENGIEIEMRAGTEPGYWLRVSGVPRDCRRLGFRAGRDMLTTSDSDAAHEGRSAARGRGHDDDLRALVAAKRVELIACDRVVRVTFPYRRMVKDFARRALALKGR